MASVKENCEKCARDILLLFIWTYERFCILVLKLKICLTFIVKVYYFLLWLIIVYYFDFEEKSEIWASIRVCMF